MFGGIRTLRGPLLVLAVISFVSSMGISIMLPLLPLYGLHLGASPLQLGLITSAFAIANSVGQLGAGLLIDRYGSRRFILAGTGTYAVANALIATAPNALALIAYRALAGFGAGTNLVSTRLYIAEIADPARMAFTNSVLSAANSAGNVVGPAFGGLIAVATDLRAPFVIVAITSGLAFVAATLRPRPRPHAGTIARDAAAPASALNRGVFALLVANFMLLLAFGAWVTTYAPFATTRLGWTTFDVGIIFTIFGIGDITLGPMLGHLADRTGRRRIAVLATIPITVFGLALVLGLPRLVIYAISFLTGSALTAFNASWFALLNEQVRAARRGRVFGTVSAVGNVGTVAGALGAATLWQSIDLALGLYLASAATALAGVAILFVPARASSPAGRAPEVVGSPASR
jgi:MFS family permease